MQRDRRRPTRSTSASKLLTCRPKAFRSTTRSARSRCSRSSTIIPAHVPKTAPAIGADRLVEAVQLGEAHDRRRLAARDHETVEPVELLRQADLDDVGAERAKRRERARERPLARRGRRCAATSPRRATSRGLRAARPRRASSPRSRPSARRDRPRRRRAPWRRRSASSPRRSPSRASRDRRT